MCNYTYCYDNPCDLNFFARSIIRFTLVACHSLLRPVLYPKLLRSSAISRKLCSGTSSSLMIWAISRANSSALDFLAWLALVVSPLPGICSPFFKQGLPRLTPLAFAACSAPLFVSQSLYAHAGPWLHRCVLLILWLLAFRRW